jgi:putative tryptophan/tyrosine transport system substrate-binding protein
LEKKTRLVGRLENPRTSGLRPNPARRSPLRLGALLLCVLVLAPVVACGVTGSQGASKTLRIGYIEGGAPGPTATVVDGFVRGLREHGWENGKNVSIEFRFAEGQEGRLAGLVRELVTLDVDVLLTATTQATREAKTATSTTPIVFAGLADPVGAGVVDNPARPGGNLTGTSLMTSNLHGKHLQLLKETVPGLSRVAVFLNPSGPSLTSIEPLEEAASSLGIEPLVLRVSSPEDFGPRSMRP